MICLLLFSAACLFASAQKLTYKQSTNDELVYVLNNMEGKFATFNNNELFIKVYLVTNVSGSADGESCEVNNFLYIATSNGGEAPDEFLFKLAAVYDPKFVKWIKSPKPQMVFTYGEAGHRKTAIVTITLKGITILKS